jgi:hypothetical protein
MKQNSRIIAAFCTTIMLLSCGGPLTKETAAGILRKAYTGNNNPDEAGGSRVIVNSITIDSIHQSGDTALAFYQVSGSVENGSKYPKDLNDGEQQDQFKRSLFGWKEK